MIEAEGLCKSYKKVTALKDISLKIGSVRFSVSSDRMVRGRRRFSASSRLFPLQIVEPQVSAASMS